MNFRSHNFESNTPISRENLEGANQKPTFFNKWGRDLVLIAIVIAVTVFSGVVGEGFKVNLQLMVLGTAAIAIFSHVIRKILLPYIDLAEYAKEAIKSPIGAAIVFASVMIFLSVVFDGSLRLLR